MANKKLFIFDLNDTILRLNINKEQSSYALAQIIEYLHKLNPGIIYKLKPSFPMIQFYATMIAKDQDEKDIIVQKCYSILDEMELKPVGGTETINSNVSLLNRLYTKGYHLGIITNNGRAGTHNALNNTKIPSSIFDFIITRDDVEYTKPFTDPYMKIINKIFVHDCYVFSDNALDLAPLDVLSPRIQKFIVINMDIKNQSHNWNAGTKFSWNNLI